jgi:mRNA interferase MazF
MSPDRARSHHGDPPIALRGEIWEVDLDPRKGREQRGVRPCLIVSTDGLNRSRFGTVIVCPITTTERKRFTWRPGLTPEDLRIADATWQAQPHWVQTDQIVTIDASERLLRHLATVVNPQKMREVDEWLRRLLLPGEAAG